MYTQKWLEACFLQVKAQFFSDWDREATWSIALGEFDETRGKTGYCDDRTRRILFSAKVIDGMTEGGLKALVIHEICHDTSSEWHDNRWADEMDRCKAIAYELGELQLARNLSAQVYAELGRGDPKEWMQF